MITLKEMKSKTFILRQKRDEIWETYQKKASLWFTNNPKPAWWKRKDREEWKKRNKKLTDKYYQNKIHKDLEFFQSQCSHIFADWTKNIAWKTRQCSICGYTDIEDYYAGVM